MKKNNHLLLLGGGVIILVLILLLVVGYKEGFGSTESKGTKNYCTSEGAKWTSQNKVYTCKRINNKLIWSL